MCQKLFDFTDSVPLDQIGLNEKALNQESEAVKSYGGSRTFASLGPVTYEIVYVKNAELGLGHKRIQVYLRSS